MVHKRKCNEILAISELFTSLKVGDYEHAFKILPFKINIKTPYGFKKIDHIFRTEKQESITCYFTNGKTLKCSRKHRLKSSGEWKTIDDITSYDILETFGGMTKLKRILPGKQEILYDLSVDDVHCYYSNGILSHNSFSLVHLGAHALKMGINVLHYSLELNEDYVSYRYDACLSGIPLDDLKYSIPEIKKRLNKYEGGQLIIKEYPTRSVGLNTLRSHADKVKMIHQSPTLILVDYLDILRIQSKKENRKDEDLEELYEEFRGWGGEMDCAVWSVSQGGRGGSNKSVLEADVIAGAYSKGFVADFWMSLGRNTQDKMRNTAQWNIIKNRFGVDGMVLPGKFDTSRSLIEIYNERTETGKKVKQEIISEEAYQLQLGQKRYESIMNKHRTEPTDLF